jgi:hypothetical protein
LSQQLSQATVVALIYCGEHLSLRERPLVKGREAQERGHERRVTWASLIMLLRMGGQPALGEDRFLSAPITVVPRGSQQLLEELPHVLEFLRDERRRNFETCRDLLPSLPFFSQMEDFLLAIGQTRHEALIDLLDTLNQHLQIMDIF